LHCTCRPKPDVKAQRQASINAEIEKVKVWPRGTGYVGLNAKHDEWGLYA